MLPETLPDCPRQRRLVHQQQESSNDRCSSHERTNLLDLESLENVIQATDDLDRVGFDVVLGEQIDDSGDEVVEPLSVAGDDGEGHTGEEFEGLQESETDDPPVSTRHPDMNDLAKLDSPCP